MSVYLDHHATTPVDPRVVEAMLPCFTEVFGNATSRLHRHGWEAQRLVDTARRDVAALMGAPARTLIFTSGATEANLMAITGVAEAAPETRRTIVTVATEHASVLEACRRAETRGIRIVSLPVDGDGRVSLDALREAVGPDTLLVSVMLAQNEVGVIQPLADVARIAHEAGALVHTDAVQALGKIPVDLTALDVDLASFSAHKVYGPKGVGALYVRPGIEHRLTPPMRGGGQERGLRGGTLNVPGIVGFGVACRIARADLASEGPRLASLRDRLWTALQTQVPGVRCNGATEPRLPGNLHVTFTDTDGEALMQALSEISVSSGAACQTATPSHVLLALGLSPAQAQASLRFGLGRGTTVDEIDRAAAHVAAVVAQVRRAARVA
jgi:cysteine desulfurase